jgi:DNA-binding transcriptional MerR regulator
MPKPRSTSDEDAKAQKTVSIAGKIKFGEGSQVGAISGRDTVVQTGGGAYIGGNVSTGGGDFVGRDQVKTVYQQQGVSIEDLRKLLAEVRALLPQAGLDPEMAEVVEGDFKVVEAQAAKDQPAASLIKRKLNAIAETVQEAGKTSDAVDKILKLLARGMALVGALF